MKDYCKKLLSITLVFGLITVFFIPANAGAQTFSNSTDEEVEELAEVLKFIFEEATIKDQKGNPIDLDIELIEEEFGPSSELEKLKKTIAQEQPLLACEKNSAHITTFSILDNNKYIECVADKLGSWAGDFVPTTLIASVLEYINDGDYLNAAKKISKAGIKGSVWGIAGTLGWIVIECNWEKNNY